MSGFRAGKRARTDSISSTSSAGSGLGIGHGSGSEHESETSSSPAPFNKIQRSDPRSPKDALHDLECSLPPTCFPATRSFETAGELERHQLAFHTYICRTPVRDRTGSTSQAQGAAANPAQGVWDVPREFTSRHGGDRWKECRKVFPDERLLDLVSRPPVVPSFPPRDADSILDYALVPCLPRVLCRPPEPSCLAYTYSRADGPTASDRMPRPDEPAKTARRAGDREHPPRFRGIKRAKAQTDDQFQCFVPPPTCTRTFINPKHRRLHLIDRHSASRHLVRLILVHAMG